METNLVKSISLVDLEVLNIIKSISANIEMAIINV